MDQNECFLSFISAFFKIINLFWPLRILISYSLQNTKYVYISSHQPVSVTLLDRIHHIESELGGLRLKPFLQPKTLHYITGKYIAIYVRTHICTMNTVHHFIYKRICASFETGKTIPNRWFYFCGLGLKLKTV